PIYGYIKADPVHRQHAQREPDLVPQVGHFEDIDKCCEHVLLFLAPLTPLWRGETLTGLLFRRGRITLGLWRRALGLRRRHRLGFAGRLALAAARFGRTRRRLLSLNLPLRLPDEFLLRSRGQPFGRSTGARALRLRAPVAT